MHRVYVNDVRGYPESWLAGSHALSVSPETKRKESAGIGVAIALEFYHSNHRSLGLDSEFPFHSSYLSCCSVQ